MAAETPPIFLQAGSHDAEHVRRFMYATMGQRGGVVNSTDLAVSQNGTPNMSVNVAAGQVYVLGTESANQGLYYGENRSTANLAIAAADSTNARRDLVVARVKDAAYSGATNSFTLEVVTGTPAGSPADPTVPANCWVLARVAVAAGATTVVTANITDLRTSYTAQTRAAALGGVIVATSGIPPTTNLYAGLPLWTTDTKSFYVYNGSTWDLVSSVATTWTAPTLTNSWQNFGGAYAGAAYRKVGDMVQLRGLIKLGTIGAAAFTLPVGFRPPADLLFSSADAGVVGEILVTSGGAVTPSNTNNTYQSLSAIQFSTSS